MSGKNKTVSAAEVFGQAVNDFYRQNKIQDIIVQANHFADDKIPVDYLFRNFEEMPELEQIALKKATGKILDVGACAGSHSLALQDLGENVTAIDLSEKTVETCQERGVKNALVCDFFDLENQQFDTLLLLMNGSGIVGKFSQLPNFFKQLKNLLSPKGQVLLDSSDLRYLYSEEELVDFYDNQIYFGDFQYKLRYKNLHSEKFNWLYIDFQTLTSAAEQYGFKTEFLFVGENDEFLARLELA